MRIAEIPLDASFATNVSYVVRIAYPYGVTTTLADALTARQRAAGHLTDREVAARIGTAESTYSRWRNGAMVPRDHEAPRLAAFLGLDLDQTYVLLARSRSHRAKVHVDAQHPDIETVSKADFDELRAKLDRLVASVETLLAERSGAAESAPR